MSKKNSTAVLPGPFLISNGAEFVESMNQWLKGRFADRPFAIVCVRGWSKPMSFRFENLPSTLARVLVIFEGRQIDPEVVQAWRDWVMRKKAWDVRMAILDQIDEDNFNQVLGMRCVEWSLPVPGQEEPAITKGEFVKMPGKATAKDDSSLLTMMFGSMGETLSKLEVAATRFQEACQEADFDSDKAETLRKKVSTKLALKSPKEDDLNAPETGLENLIDHFPKVLLHGESGVGKTLIAAYLQSRTGLVEGRPRRIPLPEYLEKEGDLEFALFGYAKGAYTGGKDDGDPGLLVSHMGGVIFLDEIGQTNTAIQAKLLAFLDDYRVRPRGWTGDPFHCPVLIVAATNLDLDELAEEGEFAGDLLARFTDRLTIPPLRDRMEDIEYILDCLLQRGSLNRDGAVSEIGDKALQAIKKRKFEKGNFRELEDWFRLACQRAARDGRHYLVEADV